MVFKQQLLCILFCLINLSVLGVDGERFVSDIPDDIPYHVPADIPSEFSSKFQTEFPVSIPSETKNEPKEEMVKENSRTLRRGCSMNLCFALDGSNSISSSEYQRQRFLARLIAEMLPANEHFGLAAVQYNVGSTPISPLTLDINDFITHIRGSRQEGDIGTFLVAGINYCFSELVDPNMTGSLCGINKIIVMGDGKGNIGADPVARAREFEQRGGEIYTVAFGNADIGVLTAIAGDVSRVLLGVIVSGVSP